MQTAQVYRLETTCNVPSLEEPPPVLRLPGMRFLRMAAAISSNVKSGCSTISPSKNSAYSSSGEVLPPLGFAATLPVCSQRWAQITTTLA
jgi:hypothetical protein